MSLGASATWHHHESCESTNDEAQRLGRAGAPHGSVVTATTQTRGRGRLGRSWHAAEGDNLFLSLLLRPPLLPAQAPLLTLCAGVALYDVARAELVRRGADASPLCLKWPNDLIARGSGAGERPGEAGAFKKLGGILTELAGTARSIDFVVIGVGCNLNARAFPEALPATSLRLLAERAAPEADLTPLAPRRFAEALASALLEITDRYVERGPAEILADFAERARLEDQRVEVRLGDRTLQGRTRGVAEDGALLVETAAGRERIVAGEIVYLL